MSLSIPTVEAIEARLEYIKQALPVARALAKFAATMNPDILESLKCPSFVAIDTVIFGMEKERGLLNIQLRVSKIAENGSEGEGDEQPCE